MQARFERRTGRSPHNLVAHPRFRAAFDFLLLRCQSGEAPAELGEWWTDFAAADAEGREALLARAPVPAGGAAKKRRRRSGGRRGGTRADGDRVAGPAEETSGASPDRSANAPSGGAVPPDAAGAAPPGPKHSA